MRGKAKADDEWQGGDGADSTDTDETITLADTRHPSAKRPNNPPAGIAAEGTVRVIPKVQYAYNPHLPPVLRLDQHGWADLVETRLLCRPRIH